MSNFNDFPNINNQKPIMKVGEDLRSIQRNLNTLIIDIQSIKSDIAEIKLYIKEREDRETPDKEEKDISKGWWYN